MIWLVISVTSADNAVLVGDLVSKLRATLESLHVRYKLADCGPFEKLGGQFTIKGTKSFGNQ